jgi:putative SOS response-associated peptidase YedK
MCGRATVVNPNGIESRFYGFTKRFIPSDWKPRYNLNPREDIPVVHVDPDSGERVLRPMHWNLIPAYVESREKLEAFDAAYSTFNAKIERVATAPTFRDSWRRQRCLVVVDGIIEWVGPKGRKIPHWIRHKSHASFAMAGLCSAWRGKSGGEPFWSCTVVIGPGDDWYSRFHHRMALLLRPELYDPWLDPDLVEPERVRRLLDESPYPLAEEMEAMAISKRVNNPAYDAPDCLEAVTT